MARAAAAVRKDDLRWLMSWPEGRRIVLRLIEDSGLRYERFSADPYANAYESGKRSFARQIESEIRDLCPNESLTMDLERANAKVPIR